MKDEEVKAIKRKNMGKLGSEVKLKTLFIPEY